VERSWSDEARAAFAAYPWPSERERTRARRETELVSGGERVELEDLPLAVRRHAQRSRYTWHGESWRAAVDAFERAILSQALAAHAGRVASTARALKTTPRVVAYAARRLGLACREVKKISKTEKQNRKGN